MSFALGYITNICYWQTHISFQMNASFHGNSLKVYRGEILNVHQTQSLIFHVDFCCGRGLPNTGICSRSFLLKNGQWDLKFWSLDLQPAVLPEESHCLPVVLLLLCPSRTVSSSPRCFAIYTEQLKKSLSIYR